MRTSSLQLWVMGGVLVALAALVATPPEPSALRTQGFVRLLEGDRERSGQADPSSSLFATLADLGPGELRLHVASWAVRLESSDLAREHGADTRSVSPSSREIERLRRALATQLAVWDANREGERPPTVLLSEEEGERADEAVRLEVELIERGRALEARFRLLGGPEQREVRSGEPWTIPTRWALAPPLLAVIAALLFGQPILALLAGVGVGAVLLRVESGATWAAVPGGVFDIGLYFWRELTSSFRIEILGLVLALVAMIGILQASGAIEALVVRLARIARSARATLGMSFGLGLLIFFDDYSNCLIVGNSMRPLADRTGVAREKLAFVVDSTAAPVAGLSLLSTWIAFEVSLYAPHLASAGFTESGYAVFVQSLPYRFYSIFALCFVLICILSNRDFGPMRRARPVVSSPDRPEGPSEAGGPGVRRGRAWHALLALGAVVGVTVEEIVRRGRSALAQDPGLASDSSWETWIEILSAGGGTTPLLCGALVGFGLSLVLALSSRVPGRALLGVGTRTMRGLLVPVGILFGAWMIASVCRDARTADLLVALLGGSLSPLGLPLLLFVSSAAISFATGTSWGTMSLLLPNVVALAASVGADHPVGAQGMVLISIGAVLEGSIFGDHCSPISDTTVLSSLASGSDHLAHVRTQLPYACSVASIAMLAGYLPTLWLEAWGFSEALLTGVTLALVLLLGVGRPPEPAAPSTGARGE